MSSIRESQSSDVGKKSNFIANITELWKASQSINSRDNSNGNTFNIIQKLLFPAPYPPHYNINSFKDKLFWIPAVKPVQQAQANTVNNIKTNNNNTTSSNNNNNNVNVHQNNTIENPPVYAQIDVNQTPKQISESLQYQLDAVAIADQHNEIPCLFLPYNDSDILLVHCHGNGCDLGSMYDTLVYYCIKLKVHVISFEYSGYGISLGQPSESAFHSRAQRVYNFITNVLNYPSNRILLFGNSIGTGVCCKLAATLNSQNIALGGIILQSPFIDINNVVKHLGGNYIGSVASKLLQNKFNNLQCVQYINSPILFIHGKRDTLIPYQHTDMLYEQCISQEKHLLYINQATHNEWDIKTDICKPVQHFINQYLRPPNNYDSSNNQYNVPQNITIPHELYDTPHSILQYIELQEQRNKQIELEKQRKQETYQRYNTSYNNIKQSFSSKISSLFNNNNNHKPSSNNTLLNNNSRKYEISEPISGSMHISNTSNLKSIDSLQSPNSTRDSVT